MATETIATYSVPEHYVKMYTANVRAAIARNGGLLRPHVSSGSYKGEKVQVVNFLGPVEFVQRDTPYSDTKLTEVEHTSRWIAGWSSPRPINLTQTRTARLMSH